MRAAVQRFTSSLAHDAVTNKKFRGLGLLLVCPYVHLPAFPKEAGPKFRDKGELFSGVFASISVRRKEALRIGWILSPHAGATRPGLSKTRPFADKAVRGLPWREADTDAEHGQHHVCLP